MQAFERRDDSARSVDSRGERVPYDLVGSWVVESRYPQGMLTTAAEFTRGEDGLLGQWNESFGASGPLRQFKISELKQDQASVSFKIRTANGTEWYWTRYWTGKFERGDQLSMEWVAPDGHVVQSRIFRRVSPEELMAITSRAPALITRPLPLPPPRQLPWDGLAVTPPMGWSSWNHFKESIDDRTVREIADVMVSSGLRDAGYVYVNIDDGWQGDRDAEGMLHANSKFPDMKALADYVHAKGLKLGIYSSPGPVTCCGYLGSHGYELQDARTFARWGIDLIRHDWCTAGVIYKTQAEMQATYQKMGEALRAAGRPIVYTLCQYGLFKVGSWGRKVGGHMWRTGPDMAEGLRWEMISQRFEENGSPEDQVPGGWNDPDHMVIGLDGIAEEEERTHMTLWAIQGAPLILGNDLRAMSQTVKRIVLNPGVIAIDQDPLGKNGRRIVKDGTSEVWLKPLADGSSAVALFNRGGQDAEVSVKWADLGLHCVERVRDVWAHADMGACAAGYQALIPSHGSVLLRVEGRALD